MPRIYWKFKIHHNSQKSTIRCILINKKKPNKISNSKPIINFRKSPT